MAAQATDHEAVLALDAELRARIGDERRDARAGEWLDLAEIGSCEDSGRRRGTVRSRGSVSVERGEQPRAAGRPAVAVVGASAAEQLALAVEQVRHRGVDGLPAGGGEPHEDAAAVVGVGLALDEAARARAGRRGWSSSRW